MSGEDEIDPLGPTAGRIAPTTPLAGSEAASAATASSGVGASEGIEGDAAIAEALASGRIDPAQAQALLLDEVLADQLVGASVEELERVRELLRELLLDDPVLADLLRPV